MKTATSLIVGFSLLTGSFAYASESCQVESGTSTAALVELYTSEGCSSCPPADEFLQKLQREAGSQVAVIPLALHVTYWDQIGWKDVFAQKAFDTRQRSLVSAGRGKVVYTPQFFVNGREERNWRGTIDKSIQKANAAPAEAKIGLKTLRSAPNKLLIEANASTQTTNRNFALYVAVSENKLVSNVKSGENSGATLRHDATVRSWFGPIAMSGGTGGMREEITLPSNWKTNDLQAVAFVQNLDDGGIVQAVSTAQCTSEKRS